MKLIYFLIFFAVTSTFIYGVSVHGLNEQHEEVHKAIFKYNGCDNITSKINVFTDSYTTATCPDGVKLSDHDLNEIVTYNINSLMIPISLIAGMLLTIGTIYFTNNSQPKSQEVKQWYH